MPLIFPSLSHPISHLINQNSQNPPDSDVTEQLLIELDFLFSFFYLLGLFFTIQHICFASKPRSFSLTRADSLSWASSSSLIRPQLWELVKLIKCWESAQKKCFLPFTLSFSSSRVVVGGRVEKYAGRCGREWRK